MKATSLLCSLIFVLCSFTQNLAYLFTPTLEFDASTPASEVTHGACGFLYGMAESGVPSKETVKTLDITSSSQKLPSGLQHPIGDADHVAENLTGADYIVVYLQDCFDTWYYCYDEIDALRKSGGYDSADFVRHRFLPQVSDAVSFISRRDYADRTVFCLYNECDNAVWFGTRTDEGWLAFDDEAKARFYSAWKETYDTVKSIYPAALIGGPGYCDWDGNEISHFLAFCRDNACLPDVMIYHELSDISAKYWGEHVAEYRQIEKSLGIGELPVIVTEYGTMQECGAPSGMLHYITAIESSGTYGNIAYWRLADNLCDTCARANEPNSEWWLFKWYSDMRGKRLEANVLDLLHSDVANAVKYRRNRFLKSDLDGIACLGDGRADIICSGTGYDFQAAVKNAAAAIGKDVKIKIEAVTFEGLSGAVNAPAVLGEYTQKVFGTLKIKVACDDEYAVYHIEITKNDGGKSSALSSLPQRFEFEDGSLLGSAYTYDSAYATTGAVSGMCGGFERDGDGITLDFTVPKSGNFRLHLIYGKCNDGRGPEGRVDAKVNLSLDGRQSVIRLPNTIKSEYTDKFTLRGYFEKGSHSITLTHNDGTFVLDSLLVEPDSDPGVYTCFSERHGELLVIVPRDGYYAVNGESRYLKRGFNFVTAPAGAENTAVYTPRDDFFTVSAEDFALEGTACLCGEDEKYTGGISSEGGSASFTVNVPSAGTYALTLTYSNNEERGVHAYNVDIVEEYVTVTANGESTQLWCTNTYSFETKSTAVAYITLAAGENTVTLSNDGGTRFATFPSNAPRIYSAAVNMA